MALRILHVLGSLNMGGAESFVMNLYRHIDRTKTQFDFVVHSDEETEYTKEILEMGGKIYVFPKPGLFSIIPLIHKWREFFLEHREYCIIHSHIRSYASIILFIAKQSGRITIAHSHSISNGKGFESIVKSILQLPIRHQADYLFACSDDAGRWLYGKNAIRKNNYYVIRNGIDIHQFEFNEIIRKEYREKLNLQDKYTYINVANFRKVKNQSFLVLLIQRLIKKNENIHLLLVGEGAEKNALENVTERLHLTQYISFLGGRNDVPALLQAADCFLFPSLWEGFGISAIEAQAAGLTTICSDKVPEDVMVTPLCKRIPLDIGLWVEETPTAMKSREDYAQSIVNKGFDIVSVANWLEVFYINIAQKSEGHN